MSDTLVIAIPSNVAQYSDDIRRFVDAMVYKLSAKSSKGRWESYTLPQALDLLKAEVIELEDALGMENMIEIILEAADVANFAMIVAAISIERGK